MKANFLSISLVSVVFLGLFGCATTPPEEMSETDYRTSFCHFDGAYKLGMNDALAGKPMSAMVARPCEPAIKVDTERGYREGYTKGIESRTSGVATKTHVTEAPPAADANGNPAPVAVAPAPLPTPDSLSKDVKTCASAKDCKGGQFCKPRADKLMVCMGEGKHGAFCDAHVDCASAGFCRTNGDGLKRCMKNGGKGQICVSSTDCEESLLCISGPGKNKICR